MRNLEYMYYEVIRKLVEGPYNMLFNFDAIWTSAPPNIFWNWRHMKVDLKNTF